MSFFETFLSNLDAPTFQTDISLNPTDKIEDLKTNMELRARALMFYNYWNEKEAMQDALQVAQLKKILTDNFPTLFYRKAKRFKVNVTVPKLQELVQVLIETNYIQLLPKFLKEFPADLVPKNINLLIINIISKNQNDEKSAETIKQLINYYKITNLSDVQNFYNLAQMRGFAHCANLLKTFMKVNNQQLSAIDLFLYNIKPNKKADTEETAILKEKISSINLNEWRLIFKTILENNLTINDLPAFEYFKADCGFDPLTVENDLKYPLLGEFISNWDKLIDSKISISGQQAFLLAVMAKHNNPALKKSVITLVKDYHAQVQKDNIGWTEFAPKFPILWWGAEKNIAKYQLSSMWKNIEHLKEVAPLLTIGKVSELSLVLFKSKSTTYTKLLSEILNDGAKEGSINWLRLGFLISVNNLFDSPDDFQTFVNKLDKNELNDATLISYNIFLNPLEVRNQEVINAVKTFNKEAKINIFSSKVNSSMLRDTLNMMMRVAKIHFIFTPKSTITSWKEYHDFMMEENKKIKTKGIKLNQEELIPLLHGKVLSGLTCYVPQFSEELVAAGEHLGICVGTSGYETMVARKKSNILFFMQDREIKYVIHFNDHRLIEAKGNSNHFLPGVRETLVKVFLKDNWWNNPKRTYKNSNNNYGFDNHFDHFDQNPHFDGDDDFNDDDE